MTDDPRELAASRVLVALAAGREPDADPLKATIGHLTAFARRAFPALEADEVVQTALVGLWSRSRGLANREVVSAWAYMAGATRNAALDILKARRRRSEVQESDAVLAFRPSGDDAIAALLDRDATHSQVARAFAAAIEAGEDTTVPVITVWLDLAEELGRAPKTREVAPHAGVSHATVATSLKRFREYLSPDQAD